MNKYLEGTAKGLVISEPIARWQNLAEFGRWRALAPSQSIPLKAITQVTRISNKHIGNLLKMAVQGGYLSGLLALPASAGVALAIYSVL